ETSEPSRAALCGHRSEVFVPKAVVRIETNVVHQAMVSARTRKRDGFVTVANPSHFGHSSRMQFGICNEIFQGWNIDDTFRYASKTGYDFVEIAPFTVSNYVTDMPAPH